MACYDVLQCIVKIGDGSKVIKSAAAHGVKAGIISMAKGTAHGHFLEVLKINDLRKEIVTLVVKSDVAKETIKNICEDMRFDKAHHGILFSHSLSEVVASKNKVHEIAEINEEKEIMYKAIYVIVENGKADDVVDAAKKAGARGGTVMHARESGLHETQRYFSIEIEPEVEKVLIIVDTAAKDTIIEAIKDHLDINESGEGIIFVLDINEAYGLHVD